MTCGCQPTNPVNVYVKCNKDQDDSEKGDGKEPCKKKAKQEHTGGATVSKPVGYDLGGFPPKTSFRSDPQQPTEKTKMCTAQAEQPATDLPVTREGDSTFTKEDPWKTHANEEDLPIAAQPVPATPSSTHNVVAHLGPPGPQPPHHHPHLFDPQDQPEFLSRSQGTYGLLEKYVESYDNPMGIEDVITSYGSPTPILSQWDTYVPDWFVNQPTEDTTDREVVNSVRDVLFPPDGTMEPNPSTDEWSCRKVKPFFKQQSLIDPEPALGLPTFEDLNNNPPPCSGCPPTIEQKIAANTVYEEEYNPEFVGSGVTPAGPVVVPPPPVPIEGCMDPNANNYNPNATVNTTTVCTYDPPTPVEGCMDPNANNYDANATVNVPAMCTYDPVVTPGGYAPSFTRTSELDERTMINNMTALSQSVSSVTSQDPDGIGWLSPSRWAASTWDGTPLDTTNKTNSELCSFLFPNHTYILRGLREKFYAVNPFADNQNPTIEEIDNWNVEVIRHVRALLGNTTPVRNDARLYIECRIADERQMTESWDTDYPIEDAPPVGNDPPVPAQLGWAWGPCHASGIRIDNAGGHCGGAFWPNATDRQPYIDGYGSLTNYPELSSYTFRVSKAEGVNSVANQDLPWSIKFSRVIGNWICSEGLSGHAGPYVNPTTAKENFGHSWWTAHSPGVGSAQHRAKWF